MYIDQFSVVFCYKRVRRDKVLNFIFNFFVNQFSFLLSFIGKVDFDDDLLFCFYQGKSLLRRKM